jgi:peroxiredoxin
MKKTLALFLSLLLVSSCTFAKNLPEPLKLGSPMPKFELKDHQGNMVSSDSLAGKVVIFEWINPDCPFVRRHYREATFQKLVKDFGDKIVWLSVNSTNYMDAEPSSNWVKSNKLTWPILVDQTGEVGKLFGAQTTPHVFVFDAAGKLAYQGAVDNDEYGTEPNRKNYLNDAINAVLAGSELAVPETKAYGCSVKYKS